MTYSNGESKVKRLVRDFVVEQSLSHVENPELNVFSLPADNFLFERNLHSSAIFDRGISPVFTMVEANKEVYDLGLDRADSVIGDYHHMTTTEYLVKAPSLKDDKKFDIVWLDYCGLYSPNVRKDLRLLKERLTPNSSVYITLLGNRDRRSYYEPIEHQLGKSSNTLHNIRMKAIPADMTELLGLPLASITSYRDNTARTQAAPMLLYELRQTEEKYLYDLTYTKKAF